MMSTDTNGADVPPNAPAESSTTSAATPAPMEALPSAPDAAPATSTMVGTTIEVLPIAPPSTIINGVAVEQPPTTAVEGVAGRLRLANPDIEMAHRVG
jgi:hypothetical protein